MSVSKIRGFSIKFLFYLWSNVVGCAAECFGFLIAQDAFFAHPIIGYFNVSFGIQQNIVQFEVTVNDALTVQKKQADCYLSRVESLPKINKIYFPP